MMDGPAYHLVILPQAEADIRAGHAYLAEHSSEAATRWVRLVKAAMSSLEEMPLRAPTAPEAEKLGFPLRQLLYGQRPGVYRIVFRVLEVEREVHVLTVRHSARRPFSVDEMELFLEL